MLQEEIPPVTTAEEQRIVNSYRRLLQGKDWEIVRHDLIKKFAANKPDFTGDFDPYKAAYKSGTYAVFLHISTRLLQTVQNDSNIPELIVRK